MQIDHLSKTILISLFALIFYVPCLAHIAASDTTATDHRAQNIFLELYGPGLTVSVNYDARIGNSRNGLGYRIGIGYLPDKTSNMLDIPLQLNYLLGGKNNFLEIGGGATYIHYSGTFEGAVFPFKHNNNNNQLGGTVTVGYRRQPVNGGFNFRVNMDPIFSSTEFYFFSGISLGYTFK